MACLNEARVQAVADGEATAAEVDHVTSCAGCRARVDQSRAAVGEFARRMAAMEAPPLRLRRAGATTLREESPMRPRRPAWILGGALAAATVIALFVVFPSIDPRTRLNASEILNRSLATLQGSGVETLEYELTLAAPAAFPLASGTYRVEQRIDHDGGRWRFGKFAGGAMVAGIAEDPGRGTRDAFVQDGGHAYRFHFTVAQGSEMPLWDLQRRYAETVIRVVQASGARVVSTQGEGADRRYVVELPQDVGRAQSALFDIAQARVVIDANDYHVIEFSASGTAMGEQSSVAYRLIERRLTPQASDDEFALPHVPGEIELSGEGTRAIPRDVLVLLLRQAAR